MHKKSIKNYYYRIIIFLGLLICLCYLHPESVSASQSESDPSDQSIQYEYDELNRVIKAIYQDGTIVLYEYDNNGNLISTKVQIKNPDIMEVTTTETLSNIDISSAVITASSETTSVMDIISNTYTEASSNSTYSSSVPLSTESRISDVAGTTGETEASEETETSSGTDAIGNMSDSRNQTEEGKNWIPIVITAVIIGAALSMIIIQLLGNHEEKEVDEEENEE